MEIKQTETFQNWLNALRDSKVKGLVVSRIHRLSEGLAGDIKFVGDGIFELRIHYGSGWRVYYKKSSNKIILLLCGGRKRTQKKDIILAKKIANEVLI